MYLFYSYTRRVGHPQHRGTYKLANSENRLKRSLGWGTIARVHPLERSWSGVALETCRHGE